MLRTCPKCSKKDCKVLPAFLKCSLGPNMHIWINNNNNKNVGNKRKNSQTSIAFIKGSPKHNLLFSDSVRVRVLSKHTDYFQCWLTGFKACGPAVLVLLRLHWNQCVSLCWPVKCAFRDFPLFIWQKDMLASSSQPVKSKALDSEALGPAKQPAT